MFFVQINHTGKGFLFLIFREIKLRKYSSLHKLFYGFVSFIGAKTGTISELNLSILDSKKVVLSDLRIKLHQKVKYPENSYDRLGWFIVKGIDRKDVLKKVLKIESAIEIKVKKDEH